MWLGRRGRGSGHRAKGSSGSAPSGIRRMWLRRWRGLGGNGGSEMTKGGREAALRPTKRARQYDDRTRRTNSAI